MRSAIQVFCALLLCSCANFHIVEEGKVYRSGQMSAEALRETIEEYGIQTVIRLRGAHGQSFPLTYQPDPIKTPGLPATMCPRVRTAQI